VARSLAAAAAPSDLILIAPGWLASSFNRYYTPATAQIDFPFPDRIGALPFDDLARRIGDPAALAGAERRIAAGRAADHRLWLVFDALAPTCTHGTCGSIPADPNNFGNVGAERASQLREYATGLYGAPVRCDTRSTSGWDETLGVCLFAPR
jgi:hypothetical protein